VAPGQQSADQFASDKTAGAGYHHVHGINAPQNDADRRRP
jgi:hypothetical protein